MKQAMQWDDWTLDAQAVSVEFGELVTVRPEGADHPRYAAYAQLLERVRAGMGVDIVFVAQLLAGEPALRRSAMRDRDGTEFECDALEEAYARRLLETRPAPPFPTLPTDREARRTAMLLRLQPAVCLCQPVVDEQGVEHGTISCLARPEAFGQAGRARLVLQSVARRMAAALAADAGDDDIAASLAQRLAHAVPSHSMMAPL